MSSLSFVLPYAVVLEKGFALYGHELSELRTPIESVAHWAVKMNKKDFLGRNSILKRVQSVNRMYPAAIALLEPGIAREGYRLKDILGKTIGFVTSGTMSPSLNCSIALALTENRPLSEGEKVYVEIRKKQVAAKEVSIPFI